MKQVGQNKKVFHHKVLKYLRQPGELVRILKLY